MNNQFMMIFQVNMQADKCVILAIRIFFSLWHITFKTLTYNNNIALVLWIKGDGKTVGVYRLIVQDQAMWIMRC